MKGLLFFGVLAVFLALLLGCTTAPEDFAKKVPEVNTYMKAHPQAKMTVYSYSPALFANEVEFWESNCGKAVPLGDYFVVESSDSFSSLKVLFEKGDMSLVCSIEEKFVPPAHENTNSAPELSPTACVSQRGNSCMSNQSCDGEYISASDSDRCCKGVCVNNPVNNVPAPRPCDNAVGIVTCSDSQKCVDTLSDQGKVCGCVKCEAKVCADYGAMACDMNKTCTVDFMTTPDTNRCCTGFCYSITTTIVTEYDSNDGNA